MQTKQCLTMKGLVFDMDISWNKVALIEQYIAEEAPIMVSFKLSESISSFIQDEQYFSKGTNSQG